MKKILSLILAFIFVLSLVPVAAEETVKTDSAALEEPVNMVSVLKMAGIVDEEFKTTEELLTRGEFASLLVKANGMNEFLGVYNTSSFSDITPEVNYYEEISLAKDMGLISGYSDNTFRPNSNISVMEAAICLIRVLGYNVKAEALGGYPTGYYSIIREINLMSNLNKGYNEFLTVNDAVVMIYNALHTKVMKSSGVSNEGNEYRVEEGKTLLADAFGIYTVEGIVKGVDITNLVGENNLPPYTLLIDDKEFYAGSYNPRHLLGYYVRAYYQNEQVGEKIKFAHIVGKKNNTFNINISTVSSIENGKLITEDYKGKTKTYTYDKYAPVIYNGTVTGHEFNKEIYKDKNGNILKGTITFIDNNKDNKADVISINAYVDIIVGKKDIEKEIVYDVYDLTNKYVLNTKGEEPYVLLYDQKGEEITFDNIQTGMSLVIYDSKDDAYQQYTKAYLSTKKITGKIINKETDSEKTIITMENEETYVVSQYALDNITDVVAGRTIEATLNYFGEIAEIKYMVNPGDYRFALLTAAKKQDKFEGEFLVKLMETDGTFSTLGFANKVKIDDNIYVSSSEKDIDNIKTIFENGCKACSNEPNGNYYFQIIKYGINSDGKINYIDTVLDSDKEIMDRNECRLNNEVFIEAISGKYAGSVNMIDQKVIIGADTKVLMYPGKGFENDMSYYAIRDKKYFTDSYTYSNLISVKDSNVGYTANLFMKKFEDQGITGIISNMTVSFVTKVTQAINADGELCTKLYLYQKGARVEEIAPNDLIANVTEIADDLSKTNVQFKIGDLVPGDIIYYTTNPVNGEIDNFTIYYSKKNNKVYDAAGTNKCQVAYVIDSTDDGIKIVYKEDITTTIEDALNAGKYKVFNNTIYPITVYDTQNNKVRNGSRDDLTSKVEDSANYSEVVVRIYATGSYLIREMFIYK